MININAGHNGAIGIQNIDRIQTTTHAYFENNGIQFGICKESHDGQGSKFKIGERGRIRETDPGRFHFGKMDQ